MPAAPAKFAWPPRTAAPAPTAQTIPVASPPPSRWRAIESTWLDLSSPPSLDRLADDGWGPVEEGAYCFRCGQAVGPGEVGAEGCRCCAGQVRPWQRLVCLGPYRRPLDAVIRDLKFRRNRLAGAFLGTLLGERLHLCLRRANLLDARILLVPVPMSRRRRMRRGIDHALIIARAAAHACGGRVVRLLSRKHRPSQLQVAPSHRERNAQGSMRIRRLALGRLGPWRPLITPSDRPTVVILMDDVTTTGATLRAAARTLLTACKPLQIKGFRLWAGVLAATPLEGPQGAEMSVPGEILWETRVI